VKDLLIHTSDKKVDILMPSKVDGVERPCICFSLNQFIPFFGDYVYLFERDELVDKFKVGKYPTKGVEQASKLFHPKTGEEISYRYQSGDLGWEYRIYEPVDVQRYAIGVITNFNHMQGVLEEKFGNFLIERMIDLSK
jgi:hypothetical protein